MLYVTSTLTLLPFTDRVENEHLGNSDQYRASRAVLLPYRVSRDDGEEDVDEEAEEAVANRWI